MTFRLEKSNYSADFNHAGAVKRTKKRVVLKREFFKVPLKWIEKLSVECLAIVFKIMEPSFWKIKG